MSAAYRYRTLDFTDMFLEHLFRRELSDADRRRVLRALQLLDTDERHPSLRVHDLRGELQGVWSASASDELRITFERWPGGRKLLLTCTRHYRS